MSGENAGLSESGVADSVVSAVLDARDGASFAVQHGKSKERMARMTRGDFMEGDTQKVVVPKCPSRSRAHRDFGHLTRGRFADEQDSHQADSRAGARKQSGDEAGCRLGD
jgi:hypothetical protein